MASISLLRSGARGQPRAPSVFSALPKSRFELPEIASLGASVQDCSSGGSTSSSSSSSSSSRCRLSSGGSSSSSSSSFFPTAAASLTLRSTRPQTCFSPHIRGLASSARLEPEEVLSKARDAASSMGFDPMEVYEPYAIVDVGQQALLQLQSLGDSSGLAVVGAAVLLRLLTLPWNKRALQKQCDRGELLPAYIDIAKALQAAQMKRGDVSRGPQAAAETEVEVQRYTMMLHKFSQDLKFSPWQGMGYQFGVLMPLYIWGYFCLRGIVAHPDAFRVFVVEPTLWLDSLVLPDPCGALPAVSALMVLLNVEVNTPTPRPGQEENALYMRLVIRGAALTFAPITTLLPSAILVFMATNAMYTAAATFIFRRFMWKPPKLPQHLLLDPSKAAKTK